MDKEDFRHWAHRASDWAADYYESLPERSVRAQVEPGEIGTLIDSAPPEAPQEMAEIFADFERIIPPGMTHWQHPRFFAYFPSNAISPSARLPRQLRYSCPPLYSSYLTIS